MHSGVHAAEVVRPLSVVQRSETEIGQKQSAVNLMPTQKMYREMGLAMEHYTFLYEEQLVSVSVMNVIDPKKY